MGRETVTVTGGKRRVRQLEEAPKHSLFYENDEKYHAGFLRFFYWASAWFFFSFFHIFAGSFKAFLSLYLFYC